MAQEISGSNVAEECLAWSPSNACGARPVVNLFGPSSISVSVPSFSSLMDVVLFELSVGQKDLALQILILSIAAAWK